MKRLTDNFSHTLKNIRETLGFSQTEVFHGICSRTAWNKYEIGELTPDMLMFQVILERLGVSDERFEFIIPDALHEFFEWYFNCLSFIETGNAERLLKERDRFDLLPVVNKNIQNQHRDFIDYVIWRFIKNNPEEAELYLKRAIAHTVENIEKTVTEKKLLSAFEWHLIANLYDLEYLLHPAKRAETTYKLYALYRYADSHIDDGLVKDKIVPRLGLTFLKNDKETLSHEDRLQIENHILKILVKFFCIREIPEALKLLIEDEPAFYKKNAYIKQKEAIENVFALNGIKPEFRTELHITGVKKYTVLSDALRLGRMRTGLNADEVSFDICDVKTYSRAELGKTYPKKNSLKRIAKRLNLQWIYFKGETESGEYDDFILMSECRRLSATGKKEELKRVKEKLKARLDMEIPLNKQIIESFDIFSGNISDKEKLWEIFSYTGEVSKYSIYTREEIELLSNIARETGKTQPYRAIEMLEAVLKNVNRNNSVSKARTAIPIKDLAWLYKNIKEYEKSRELALKEMEMIFKVNSADLLLSMLDYISTIEEELGNIETAKRICVDMFYIAELYGMYKDADMIKTYYEKEFDADIKWY